MVFIPNWGKFNRKRFSGRAQINWNNPLSNNLKALPFATSEGIIDLVSEKLFTHVGTKTPVNNIETLGYYVDSSNYFYLDGLSALCSVTDSLSAFVSAVNSATTNTAKRSVSYLASDNSTLIGLDFGTGSANAFRVTGKYGSVFPIGIAGTQVADKLITFAATRKTGVSNTFKYSLNGSLLTQTTSSAASTANLAGEISRINIGVNGGITSPFSGGFFISGVFNEFSEQEKLNDLTEYPYQLVKSNPRIFYFPTTNVDLALNSLLNANTIENLILVQANTLAINNLLQTNLTEIITLTQQNTISLLNLISAQTIDNINLTQQNTLNQDSLNQTNTMENVDLNLSLNLLVDNLTALTSLLNLDLLQQNIITINNLNLTNSLENPSLAQQNTLNIAGLSQNSMLESLVLNFINILTVDSTFNLNTLSNIDLVQANSLIISSLNNLQTTQNLQLLVTIIDNLTGKSLYIYGKTTNCYINIEHRTIYIN